MIAKELSVRVNLLVAIKLIASPSAAASTRSAAG